MAILNPQINNQSRCFFPAYRDICLRLNNYLPFIFLPHTHLPEPGKRRGDQLQPGPGGGIDPGAAGW